MKIAVAMSGGVDSSVAAALMVRKHGAENVFGVTAKLFCYSRGVSNDRACCSLDAINDARAVCAKLGIAHYVISEEREFERKVIKSFIEAYRKGQTPIPCIPCNSQIKFGTMLKHVKKLGADKLATGHYARITKNYKLGAPKYQLRRGIDPVKDQTYFLHGLNQEQLSMLEFPIGGMSKAEVRAIAKKIGLKTAEKKESQGVCFVSEGTVADWIGERAEQKSGNIIDVSGRVVGRHDGIVYYTIGQRKRIGGGHEKPMYVVAINAKENEIVIGEEKDLYNKELVAGNVHWINEPKLPLKCTAKIRYNMDDESCIVQNLNLKSQNDILKLKNINSDLNRNSKLINQNYSVVFSKPQRAITPGQSVVFYKGDRCLGGGIISQ